MRQELRLLDTSALASLEEGLEETLAPHRLGVFAELGISLKTTNLLESIHTKVEARVWVDHCGTAIRSNAGGRRRSSTWNHSSAGSRTTTPCRFCDRHCNSI